MYQRLTLTLAAIQLVSYRMLHKGCKFHVKMCREPVGGLEVSQKLCSSRTSQCVRFHFMTQKLLLSQQFPCASIIVYSTWPVVAHENVHRHTHLSGKKHLHIVYINKWTFFEYCSREQVESIIVTCFSLNTSIFRMWYTLRRVSGLYGGTSWWPERAHIPCKYTA